MMKLISDIGNWLVSSGAFATLFIFSWKYVKPILEEKQKHAKTARERELLAFANGLAQNAVNSLAGRTDISGHDKFKAATQSVAGSLSDKGFKVDDSVVNHAVQSAYELSPLTPSIDPEAKPTTGVVVHD